MFQFSILIEDYDNDFMLFFFPSLEPVLEGRRLRFNGESPLAAYGKFMKAVRVGGYYNSDVIDATPSGYGHVQHFQRFFKDLERKITRFSMGLTDEREPYCAGYIDDLTFGVSGEFSLHVGGNHNMYLDLQEVCDSAPDTSLDEQIREQIQNVKQLYDQNPQGEISMPLQEVHRLCQLASLALGPRCG